MSTFFSSLWALIKNNRFAVILTVLGVIVAVLFISIGFFKTLLIAALAALGGVTGVFLDRRIRRGGDADSF